MLRLARENPRWGYQRTVAELTGLGVAVSATCLDWLLIMNGCHLERVVRVFADHYNRHRPHRSLNLKAPLVQAIRPMAQFIRLGWCFVDDRPFIVVARASDRERGFRSSARPSDDGERDV